MNHTLLTLYTWFKVFWMLFFPKNSVLLFALLVEKDRCAQTVTEYQEQQKILILHG